MRHEVHWGHWSRWKSWLIHERVMRDMSWVWVHMIAWIVDRLLRNIYLVCALLHIWTHFWCRWPVRSWFFLLFVAEDDFFWGFNPSRENSSLAVALDNGLSSAVLNPQNFRSMVHWLIFMSHFIHQFFFFLHQIRRTLMGIGLHFLL